MCPSVGAWHRLLWLCRPSASGIPAAFDGDIVGRLSYGDFRPCEALSPRTCMH